MLKETLRDALPKISIEDLLPIHWIGQGYGYKSPIVFEDVEMAVGLKMMAASAVRKSYEAFRPEDMSERLEAFLRAVWETAANP